MKDLVSIIIPVYNGEETIERAVRSVAVQTYNNLQILIVDDCSTDNTSNIIKRMAEEDSRIHYHINSKNLGVSATRNLACNLAQGDYIAFLDSDDEWYPEKLQLQLQHINEFKADVCYTAYEIVENNTKDILRRYMIPHQVKYKDLLKENVICCSTVLLKKDILKNDPFTKGYFHEDFVLWLELLRKGSKAVGLQQYLVRYARGGRSSNKINAMYNRWKVYRKCEGLNLFNTIYYFSFYAVNGIRKYYIHKGNNVSEKYEVN